MISTPFLAVFGLGMPEMVIILVILLVLFGGTKLPALAKGLGQSIKEFKKSSKEDEAAEVKPEAPVPVEAVKKPEPVKTHGSN